MGHEWKNKKNQEAFDNILDTYGGENTKFAPFMFFIRDMDQREDGDSAASQLLDLMRKFSKLIDAAQGRRK
jgi:hypothetical protein